MNLTLTFRHGIGSLVNIKIPIIDDNLIESTESFMVVLDLERVFERVSLYGVEAEIFILDNDGKCI